MRNVDFIKKYIVMNGVPMAVSTLPLVARIAVEKTLYSLIRCMIM